MFIAYLICGLRVASHDQEGEVRSCEKRTFMKVHFTTASVEIYCLTVSYAPGIEIKVAVDLQEKFSS